MKKKEGSSLGTYIDNTFEKKIVNTLNHLVEAFLER